MFEDLPSQIWNYLNLAYQGVISLGSEISSIMQTYQQLTALIISLLAITIGGIVMFQISKHQGEEKLTATYVDSSRSELDIYGLLLDDDMKNQVTNS
ncbi:MAG: hypothetical protein ACM3WQ_02705 [Chloroflexota bacterium]